MPASKEERTLANPLYTGAPPYTGAWKDAAYDPELPGRVCTAEQIRVMPTLQQVMVEYSKAVARAAPPIDLRRHSNSQRRARRLASDLHVGARLRRSRGRTHPKEKAHPL